MNTLTSTTMPNIQTVRLAINPLTPDDIKLFYAHRTHPDVLRYQGEFPRNEEDVRQLINAQNTVPFGTVNQWFQFSLRLLSDNTFIGDIVLRFNSPFIPQVEIAYSIMPSCQRKGYASESVQAMIDYCFTQLNMGIISATIDARNEASQKMLLKSGFQRMAFRPHACYLRGEWCDEEDYALFLNKYQPATMKLGA